MLPITFLKETRDELKKVTWPSHIDVIRLTIVIITVSVIVGLFIGGLDYILTIITEALIK